MLSTTALEYERWNSNGLRFSVTIPIRNVPEVRRVLRVDRRQRPSTTTTNAHSMAVLERRTTHLPLFFSLASGRYRISRQIILRDRRGWADGTDTLSAQEAVQRTLHSMIITHSYTVSGQI